MDRKVCVKTRKTMSRLESRCQDQKKDESDKKVNGKTRKSMLDQNVKVNVKTRKSTSRPES